MQTRKIIVVVLVILAATALLWILFKPYVVDGSAMSDTLMDREYVLANRWATNYARGDIVVFRPPNDPDGKYIKRIIGLPGETVVLRDGLVHIENDGTAATLSESYLNADSQSGTYPHPPQMENTEEVRYEVPASHYFVLGDNRQASLDSRSFTDINGEQAAPFVSESSIVARVFSVVLPLSQMRSISSVSYSF